MLINAQLLCSYADTELYGNTLRSQYSAIFLYLNSKDVGVVVLFTIDERDVFCLAG